MSVQRYDQLLTIEPCDFSKIDTLIKYPIFTNICLKDFSLLEWKLLASSTKAESISLKNVRLAKTRFESLESLTRLYLEDVHLPEEHDVSRTKLKDLTMVRVTNFSGFQLLPLTKSLEKLKIGFDIPALFIKYPISLMKLTVLDIGHTALTKSLFEVVLGIKSLQELGIKICLHDVYYCSHNTNEDLQMEHYKAKLPNLEKLTIYLDSMAEIIIGPVMDVFKKCPIKVYKLQKDGFNTFMLRIVLTLLFPNIRNIQNVFTCSGNTITLERDGNIEATVER